MSDLVDGNNLMGRLKGSSREKLVTELAELARRKRKKLTVVFDGPPDAGRPKVQALGDVTVVYAAPRSADEEIVRRVREARDPRGVTVVTDDHLLSESANAAGARTTSVTDFTRGAVTRLASPTPQEVRPEPPLNVSVRDWKRWFSDPKNKIK